MPRHKPFPVIDLFAGPGGLGEGFSARRIGRVRAFKSVLSIEKEASAHQTLRLRSFYRQFPDGKAPNAYYQYLRDEISLDKLYDLYPTEAGHADNEAWCVELSINDLTDITR